MQAFSTGGVQNSPLPDRAKTVDLALSQYSDSQGRHSQPSVLKLCPDIESCAVMIVKMVPQLQIITVSAQTMQTSDIEESQILVHVMEHPNGGEVITGGKRRLK